jgi:ribonuclease T1
MRTVPDREVHVTLSIALDRLLCAVLLVLAAAFADIGPAHARQPLAADALPPIRVAELPQEAQQTLALIERGGPYPYRKDGTTFGNRERRLPERARGYYREFTVKTPGERDRGARRIIAGRAGERYYTADHYGSFKRIVP